MLKLLPFLALLGTVLAEKADHSTVELWFVSGGPSSPSATIIGQDATATTYSIACQSTGSVVDLFCFAGETVTQGPSTVHFSYSDLQFTTLSVAPTVDIGCSITDAAGGAICSQTAFDSFTPGVTNITTTSYTNLPQAYGIAVTLMGGAPASTTSSLPTSSLSGSNSKSHTASSTSGATAASTSSTSSSTGGVPKMTGSAQWALGGAAVMAFAAL